MANKFKKLVNEASLEMRSVFAPTPLQKNEHLSTAYNAQIWLKREDLSPVRSYKIRGACNSMRKLVGRMDFVCASAGNHAQGVAFMSSHYGARSTIFMPTTTPQQKITKTKLFGGDQIEIILSGDYFDDCLSEAISFSESQGAHFISPFNDDDVIEGQATVAAEIEAQFGGCPDVIIMPVGGGGLSSGIVKYFGKEPNYVFVEPNGAASFSAAISAGHPIKLEMIDNFTDGAAVAEIGAKNFGELRDITAENIIKIPENRICTTILEMLNIEGIVLEPAGALSVDALKDVKELVQNKSVVCVTTGGNFDFERLPEVKERAQQFAGLKKYLILRLPQRPGSLKDFLATLGPNEDITRFEYLKKTARNFGAVLIGIETASPNDFGALFSRLDEMGFNYVDITDDEILSQFLV
tara:strand:- start:204 stop:1433 length:1230 start_codon:yes stop_codon:yes gene_type:complete